MFLRFFMKREIGKQIDQMICDGNLMGTLWRRATKIITEMEGIDDNLENDKIILVKVEN